MTAIQMIEALKKVKGKNKNVLVMNDINERETATSVAETYDCVYVMSRREEGDKLEFR